MAKKENHTERNVAIAKSVFISRNLKINSKFLNVLSAHGYQVFHQSLITIAPIRFSHTPKTEWIFFSSKNAIIHFFKQEPDISEKVRFGVMSPASAECLHQLGMKADFIGEGTDVRNIAKSFSRFIQSNDSVLFPQALDSLKSIQKELSFTNSCIDLFVYKTTLKEKFEIPECDILVFTSPSNVLAYTAKYAINDHQQVIAIGNTTAGTLKNLRIKNLKTSASFTEEGLIDAVFQVENIK